MFLKKKKTKKTKHMFYKTKTTLAPINQKKKKLPHAPKKKKNQPTSHEKNIYKKPHRNPIATS